MLQTLLRQRTTTDVVLIDTYSTQNFYFAVCCGMLSKLLKIPYIPILHGGNLEERLTASPKLCQELFNQAKVNVVPSLFLKDIFNNRGFTNLTHIANSIALKEYHFMPRKVDVPKLLWVRSFSDVYNPILALKIFKALKKQHSLAELCMVGPDKDGSLEFCKAYARTNGLDVTFTGNLEKHLWLKIAENYNIFINTANYDNAPVSVIEAMALGMPVISTNVGGIPYLIDHHKNGILVEPDNEEEFLLAINKLLLQPDLVSLITKNARQTVTNFDWEQVRYKWLKLLS